MLDDDRLRAVQDVIDSLPLSERQLDLAHETIEAMTAEEADELIELHRRVIEGLPRAREAIRQIHQQRQRPSEPEQG